MHLPAAPTHGEAAAAQHCSPQEEVCAEPEQLTPKQRRTIPLLAERTGLDMPPDLEGMDRRQAEDWLAEHWQHWQKRPSVEKEGKDGKDGVALKLDDALAVEPNATHLFFDDHYTSERDGLEFVMHQPRRTGERSVTPELPWETHIAGYNSVLQAGPNDYRI